MSILWLIIAVDIFFYILALGIFTDLWLQRKGWKK